jgi:hypothetical protein
MKSTDFLPCVVSSFLKSLQKCHAKSVAWTNRVIFPDIYNVSNGLMVIWLFGQFRWSSCNKLALFSDLSEYHLLGALLEPSLPSRVEKEETLYTPLWGAWRTKTKTKVLSIGSLLQNQRRLRPVHGCFECMNTPRLAPLAPVA